MNNNGNLDLGYYGETLVSPSSRTVVHYDAPGAAREEKAREVFAWYGHSNKKLIKKSEESVFAALLLTMRAPHGLCPVFSHTPCS